MSIHTVLRQTMVGLLVAVVANLWGCDRTPDSQSRLPTPEPITTAKLMGRKTPFEPRFDRELGSHHFSPSSAYRTGRHANLFSQFGIASPEDVAERVKRTYRDLFGGDENKRILYPAGEEMAYILDINNNDIRSEGMSYGLIITVMMDDQETFNKLWRFSKAYLQRRTGDQIGYFAWQVSATPPYKTLDANSAPDGEEYMAMALFFADHRWGSGLGIMNYRDEANALLALMVSKQTELVGPLFDPQAKQVVFSPAIRGNPFTDPSYHLPGFYELWALWADDHNQFWRDAAQVSRAFFKRASHPETGLFPEYAEFDGTPRKTGHNQYSHHSAYDAHRVIHNMAMDYAWFGVAPELPELIRRLLNFYHRQGMPGEPRQYVSIYSLEGEPLADNKPKSAIAMNAVGLMGLDSLRAGDPLLGFLTEFWQTELSTSQYRYYSGVLYMLALLHLSGEFKIYGNPNLNGGE